MNSKKLKNSVKKTIKSFYQVFPILVGIILLLGLASALFPKTLYSSLFTQNNLLDSFIGCSLGSVLAGNPVTSYILGGELLKQGVSLVAVTSFLVAWVTVGIVQFPAESLMLGRRFAILRNLMSFIFSILVAIITTYFIDFL